MKKYFLTILSLFTIVIAFSMNNDIFSYEKTYENEDSFIFDSQQSDIESIYSIADFNKTTLPELQNHLPLPSFRLIASQKKSQQNLINNFLLKRFPSEAQPTKNYNIKFSFPLSSKEDLIVIVRHLII